MAVIANYKACPKCAHAPMPPIESLPAACPACGLVLAKYAAMQEATRAMTAAVARVRTEDSGAALQADLARQSSAPLDASKGLVSRWLLHVPDGVSRINWQARAAGLVLFSLWTLWIWHDVDIPVGESGSHSLHSVLIPFHEAGHYAIFRWFGPFIMTLGGTLGQHLLPLVVGGVLLIQKRNPYGAALAFWLLGYSVIDMGVYMYDAFDPKLGLIGGGTGAESDGHDWQNIFGDLGLIRSARGLGMFFGWVGYAMMAAGLAWAGVMVWLQRARLSDSLFAEQESR